MLYGSKQTVPLISLCCGFITTFTNRWIMLEIPLLFFGLFCHFNIFIQNFLIDSNLHFVFQNILITFSNLGPVKSPGDDHPDLKRQWEVQKVCTHPIQCKGNFLFEHFEDVEPFKNYETENLDLASGKPNCSGSVTVFTRPKLRGDSLSIEESLCQLYHAEFDQKIVSVKSEGSCCWVLFEENFFVGPSERICGNYSREVKMNNSIRSILKVESEK